MKIYIVGTSGAGKTTLAKSLENNFSLKHIELDALYWLPGWVENPPEAFIEKVKFATQGNNWVVCGNYCLVIPNCINRFTAQPMI